MSQTGTAPGTSTSVSGVAAEVVQWLAAMHTVAPPAGTSLADAFRAELARTPAATTDASLTPVMAAASQVAPDKAAAVFVALPPEVRRRFLGSLLELSQSSAAAAGAMTGNVAALRLVLYRLLPAMRGIPEVAALDLEGAMSADYASLDRLAQWVRPDIANPAVLEAARRHGEQADAASRAQDIASSLAARLRAVGCDPERPEQDSLAMTPSGRRFRSTAIVLGLLLGAVLLGAVAVWLMMSKKRSAQSRGGGAAAAEAGGGGGGGGAALPAPLTKAAAAPPPAASSGAPMGPFAGGALPVAPMSMAHLMAPWSAVNKQQ